MRTLVGSRVYAFRIVFVCVCPSTSEPVHRFPQDWFKRLPLEIIPTCEVNGSNKMGTRPRFMNLYIYQKHYLLFQLMHTITKS